MVSQVNEETQGLNVAAHSIHMVITEKNNLPALELRKVSCDVDFIKAVILAAFHNKPIILQPVFTDRIKALGALHSKGIIFLNKESGQYEFLI